MELVFQVFLPQFVLCLFRHRNRRLQRLHPDAFAQPAGSYYTQWKLGSPYRKFNDKDLRKKPYRYLGNKRYEGMFLVGKQVNFDDPTKVCLGQKEYSGKVIDMVDQVARFSEVGSKYGSVA